MFRIWHFSAQLSPLLRQIDRFVTLSPCLIWVSCLMVRLQNWLFEPHHSSWHLKFASFHLIDLQIELFSNCVSDFSPSISSLMAPFLSMQTFGLIHWFFFAHLSQLMDSKGFRCISDLHLQNSTNFDLTFFLIVCFSGPIVMDEVHISSKHFV